MMRFARAILMPLLATALAAYSLDCFAAATPDEAMQCCNSMSCPEYDHDGSQDCCQTMPSLQDPFLQPHSMDHASSPLVPLAELPQVFVAQGLDAPAHILFAVDCHAPPGSEVRAATPLRI